MTNKEKSRGAGDAPALAVLATLCGHETKAPTVIVNGAFAKIVGAAYENVGAPNE